MLPTYAWKASLLFWRDACLLLELSVSVLIGVVCLPTSVIGLGCIHESLTVDRKALNLAQLLRKVLTGSTNLVVGQDLVSYNYVILKHCFKIALK